VAMIVIAMIVTAMIVIVTVTVIVIVFITVFMMIVIFITMVINTLKDQASFPIVIFQLQMLRGTCGLCGTDCLPECGDTASEC